MSDIELNDIVENIIGIFNLSWGGSFVLRFLFLLNLSLLGFLLIKVLSFIGFFRGLIDGFVIWFVFIKSLF